MPLSPATEDALIRIVRDAARDQIMPRFRNLPPTAIATKTGPEDLVTEADTAAEAQIARAIRALLPGAMIVGEEAASADPAILEGLGQAPLAAIIDPVDGTANFAAGLATFGVILAIVQRGETVFGLLHDPVLDDWVMARRGGGAWYCRPDGDPVRLAQGGPRAIERSRGFVSLALYPQARRAGVAAAFPPFARVNTLACSCHEYRQMARGHAEFMVSPLTKPWDHAAGALVIEEIGGRVTNGRGERWTPAAMEAPITATVHPDQPAPAFGDPTRRLS